MSSFRFSPRQVAGGLLLTAVLWGCDSQTPVEVPDTSQQARGSVVQDQVSQAAKEAAMRGQGSIGSRLPAVSPLSYNVESIPFQPGPTGLANLGPVCDDCVMNDVPLGFNFTFYGQTYSTLQISSNGFVRFNPPNNDSGCCSGRPIPLNDLWNNIIAFAWTDLIPEGATGGRLRWETLGTAPNRRWVLHADSVRYFGGTQPNLIQWLILHEGSNHIEIHTELMTPRVITQGTENEAGTEAHFIPGRVATTFSLVNDGVRWTPQQPVIPVPIHTAFSGPPNRDPGIIVLDDPSVFVQILNIQQYLPRMASPSDVRIGPSWETGVPAENFEILDINNDGVLDIQLRFSTQALQNAGLLPVGPAILEVWGRDPATGQLYRGTVQVTVQPGTPPPGQPCSWNNAARFPAAIGVGLITHPNGGTGPIAGQHVSMAAVIDGVSTAGSNVLLQPGGPHFRLADDFPAPAGGCVMNQVVVHGYQTGAAQPTWTSANINIRSGSVTGPVVVSATTTQWQFTGIYRTFNAVLNNADRPVFRIIFDFPNTTLPAGTYWIDWQVAGGASAWGPYITLPPVPPGGNNTQHVLENGQQMFNAAGQWQPTLAPPGAELPFLVRGPGAPPLSAQGDPVVTRPPLMPADYSLWAADRAQ
jgi:hypothetical protein